MPRRKKPPFGERLLDAAREAARIERGETRPRSRHPVCRRRGGGRAREDPADQITYVITAFCRD